LGLSVFQLLAYTDKPVMVNININRQSDTMGFNIVHEIQNKLYDLIIDNKVKLWDSPKKGMLISASALQGLEHTTNSQFNKSQNIFLHEFWTSTRRITSFTIVGISFINDGTKGKVSYGYVDLAECWAIINTLKIDCNVNGPSEITLVEALYSRNYNFNIVQFGSRDFQKKAVEAIKFRDKAFFSKKKVEGLFSIPKTKEISYYIEPNPDEPTDIGNALFNNTQTFLNDNREILFNIGGDKYFDYKTFKSEVAITRIESHEKWEKLQDGKIEYKIQDVTIYVNNKPLSPIPVDVMLNWGILYNFKTAEDVLREKKFRFTLFKLNNTFVTENDSPKFLKSLEKYPWSQLSRYVKFY
jgi:hypothetical protein